MKKDDIAKHTVKKGDTVKHICGGYGVVKTIKQGIATVEVLSTPFDDIRLIPIGGDIRHAPVAGFVVVSDDVKATLIG